MLLPQFRKIIGLVCSLRSLIKRQDAECANAEQILRRSYICLLFAFIRKKSATGADFCIELLCFLRLDFLKSRFQFKARDVADVAYHFRFVSVNGVCKRDLRAEFYL